MKWGYTISQPRAINLDTNDYRLSNWVLNNEPSLLRCFGCGSCTATCTAGNLTSFNFRKLHHALRLGEYTRIKEEVSKCMLCGKCRLVCPRGVNTRNVVVSIQKAIKEYEAIL
ncbi:MAG: 4Fe-4S dicluster domain-containing protein [Bacteroidota bacterium]|nr:4Fe-4S dicluster domain-containing protein [Bacteroidota bacterium]MDP4205646.1 4Fe-4S dicluster domain-containing protein [Bacteroidota bacterium]